VTEYEVRRREELIAYHFRLGLGIGLVTGVIVTTWLLLRR